MLERACDDSPTFWTPVVTPAAKKSAQYDEASDSCSNRVVHIFQVVQKLPLVAMIWQEFFKEMHLLRCRMRQGFLKWCKIKLYFETLNATSTLVYSNEEIWSSHFKANSYGQLDVLAVAFVTSATFLHQRTPFS